MNRTERLNYTLIFVASLLIALAYCTSAQAGEQYGDTVFYGDVSMGTWSGVAGITSGAYYTASGTLTNGVQTNYYRLSYTNLNGRGPGVAVNLAFAGNTNSGTSGTNAVRLTWARKGGASAYVIEKSWDAGATWTNYTSLAAASTNWTDYGTNAWLAGIFTNLYSAIPAGTAPWSGFDARILSNETAIADLTNLVASGDNLGNHTADTNLNMAGKQITNVNVLTGDNNSSAPAQSFRIGRTDGGTVYPAFTFAQFQGVSGVGIDDVGDSTDFIGMSGTFGNVTYIDWSAHRFVGDFGATYWLLDNDAYLTNQAVRLSQMNSSNSALYANLTNCLNHGQASTFVADPTNATWNYTRLAHQGFACTLTALCVNPLGPVAGDFYLANDANDLDNHGTLLRNVVAARGWNQIAWTQAVAANQSIDFVWTNCPSATNFTVRWKW